MSLYMADASKSSQPLPQKQMLPFIDSTITLFYTIEEFKYGETQSKFFKHSPLQSTAGLNLNRKPETMASEN